MSKYKKLWSESHDHYKNSKRTVEKWRAKGRADACAEIINDIVLNTKYIDEIKERLQFRLVQEFGNHDLVKSILKDQFENLVAWGEKNKAEAEAG
ncbi:hypothetical protein [Mycobacterium sp.]|uniref:hypothetical protein n=1 Tax=Mycobacterium sp. TaxID=1785 RepID=UPI003A86EA40